MGEEEKCGSLVIVRVCCGEKEDPARASTIGIALNKAQSQRKIRGVVILWERSAANGEALLRRVTNRGENERRRDGFL